MEGQQACKQSRRSLSVLPSLSFFSWIPGFLDKMLGLGWTEIPSDRLRGTVGGGS